MELLHFQRPGWLWALPLALLPWLAWHLRRRVDWREVVDPHLLPAQLVSGPGGGWLRPAGMSLALLLAVLALAGPGWRQEEQPYWESRAPLVIALDLSSAVTTADQPPTRLAQARAKLARLLEQRQGGEVALVVWSADAYTVAPLTADAANVALFLDALAPDVMPEDGQRVDRAITHAAGLLRQGGANAGQILLLAADAGGDALPVAAATAASGYTVSVLGLGTAEGGVYRDADGRVHSSRRNDAALRALAVAGQGRYAPLGVGDADLLALGVLQPPAAQAAAANGGGQRVWLDQGYWLLLPLALLAGLAFRRGAPLLALPLLLWMLPMAPAGAQDSPWLRTDQQAQRQLERGVEAYRRGDFDAAAEAFAAAGARGAEAQYNLGNALARQGRYDEALAAYDRALSQAPGMEDALANRKVVEAARRQRPPSAGDGSGRPQPGQDGQPAPGAPQPGDAAPGSSDAQDPEQGEDGSQPPAGGEDPSADPPPGSAVPDPAAQAEADRQQRERMQQALQQAGRQDGPAPDDDAIPGDARDQERRQAHEAWLRRVPDDPGGLLRAKFQLEHQRRQQEGR